MLLVVAPLPELPRIAGLGVAPIASLLVLGILGSGVAYVLTYAIVRAAGATTFSTVAYLIPVFSTALGVAVLGEGLGWNEPAGAAVVLAAIALSSAGPRAQRRREARAARRAGAAGLLPALALGADDGKDAVAPRSA
jgi:drug/metabolite transporter (DMT)-like permease